MKKLLALVLTIVCFGTIALSAAGCAEQKMPSFSINEAGELICTLPDGSTQNLGKVRGQDGEDGQNGRDGLDGKDGQNGLDGKDGISLPHVCSDNYYYTNTDGSVTAHCPCELEDHPAHSDRYTHSLAPLNGSQHSILCSGNGNIGTEDHTFQTVSFTDSAHTLSCACGYTAAEKHSLTYSGNFNDWIDDPIQSTHTVACACGYVDERPHELTAQSLNGGWHSVTCPCFGTENEPHLAHFVDVYIDGHLYKQCTVCGYLEW